MNYNDELQSLIRKAERDGYGFSDGKFEKMKLEKFPVMEMFLVNNSTYEATGYYDVFKKTVKISDEDFVKVLEYAKENNYKKIHCKYDTEDAFVEKIISDVIWKYDESNIEYVEVNVGGDIEVEYRDDCHIYSNHKDKCVNLWFSKPDDDDDFPRGFISFYEMTMSDFEKSDNVDLHLKKFMRDN